MEQHYIKNHLQLLYPVLAGLLLVGALNSSGKLAAASVMPEDFEKAWKEGESASEYSSVCRISADSVKIQGTQNMSADKKKILGILKRAITVYKNEQKGMVSGLKKQIYTSQTKFDSLGALDAIVAKNQVSSDRFAKALKNVSKKTVEIALHGAKTYIKTGGGWKVFEDADFADRFLSAVLKDSLSSSFEKSSFILKNPAGKSNVAVYEGTLSAAATISLLKPFIGEEAAGKQAAAPVKLSITKDGHFKKHDVVDNVTLGGLSFTVKETCTVNFGTPKMKMPSNAETVSKEDGMKEIVDSL